MPQGETVLIAGGGSQTMCGAHICDRWGDYSSMSVDPADDCTFWYTDEYYTDGNTAAAANWQTRIRSFKFPNCVGVPDLTITKTHTGNFTQGQSATYTITVTNSGAGPTSAAVSVSDALPAGLTATNISGG